MQSKVIGRWNVVVVLDERYGEVVKIYDTNYTSDFWKKENNPQGYQPTPASYNVNDFMSHQGLLILWGDVKEWTMTKQEVMDAQAFISML
jgi:hypothetical protein